MYNKKYKNIAYFICLSVFTIGVFISVNKNPSLLNDVSLWHCSLVMVFGVPVTLCLNVFEYILMGRILNKYISIPIALQVSILSSAANMLPLPGGAITRIAFLKHKGSTYGQAAVINLTFGILWLALAFIISGSGLVYFGEPFYGWLFLFTGAVLLVGVCIKLRRLEGSFSTLFLAILQRSLLIGVDSLRLWGCLLAMGANAKLSQATVFALSAVLGSAVSIIPAGLGIREGISAALAPMVGIGAAAGFLAAALNRLLDLLFLMPTASIVWLQENKRHEEI